MMMTGHRPTWWILAIITFLSGLVSCDLPNNADIERALRKDNYDKFSLPHYPQYVYIGFHVTNMGSDYQKGTLDVNVYMRMWWSDWRLKEIFRGYNVSDKYRVRLFREHVDQMWVPDIFIKNSHKVERIDGLVPELLMTVNREGMVWYVPRFVKTIYCPDLKEGKRITTCSIQFESYGYSNSEMKLLWLRSPINLDSGINITGLTMYQDPSPGNCTDNSGAYPCLSASFTWKRNPPRRVFEVGVYISSCLLLIVSWLGFWTPPGDRRIFLGLGIAIVLSVLYMSVTQYQEFAYLEVVTSAQTWLLFTFIMDLAMVLEYAFAHVLIRIIPNTFRALCRCSVPDFKHMQFQNEDELKPVSSADAVENGDVNNAPKGAMRVGYIIDMVSGIFLFPVFFVVFFVAWAGSYLPFV